MHPLPDPFDNDAAVRWDKKNARKEDTDANPKTASLKVVKVDLRGPLKFAIELPME